MCDCEDCDQRYMTRLVEVGLRVEDAFETHDRLDLGQPSYYLDFWFEVAGLQAQFNL